MTSRIERDSFGPIEVPADRLWGAQTQRALQHFRIGDQKMPAELIHALGLVKQACAVVNGELGLLPSERAEAIAAAAEEVAGGRLDDHFPLPVWQTGSATQTHMNANEVIAHRAGQLLRTAGRPAAIHPNDDVNRSQSSNDVVPTAMHVATVLALEGRLRPALGRLRATLADKAEAFAGVVKIGRTHLQDAVPLTLGQEMSGWVRQLELAAAAIEAALPALHELAIGGTAVGTGLNAPAGFGERVAAVLARWTRRPFRAAANRFAALAGHEPLVTAHGALRTLAVALIKIANDVRWLSSGPRSGLGELTIPENEPGSSIMPGKVNPTQAEALLMVATQVLGHDVAVGLAAASGNFELNVARPLIAHDVLDSIRLLADSVLSFDEHCARGLQPNRPRIREHLDRSLMLVTALAPRLGYDRAAAIAHRAHQEGRTLREVAVGEGHLSGPEFDTLVNPERMIGPDPPP